VGAELFHANRYRETDRRTWRSEKSGSLPGGVTGFFSDIFPFDRTMDLGSTQPLVKMSIKNIPGGKGDRCVRLTTSPPSCAECHEIWEPKPPGTLWATPGLLRDCFTLLSVYRICSRNLRTFFPILAAEKSGRVKYADFFLWNSWSGFYSSMIENTVRFVIIIL